MNDYINGAPLLKIERKTDDLTILSPKGFQISEEVLSEKDILKFRRLIQQLQIRINEFGKRLPSLYLSDRLVFEAIRTQIIRMTTLGITGFDSPTGINSLMENKITFQSLSNTIKTYYPFLNELDKAKIMALFIKGKSYFDVNG